MPGVRRSGPRRRRRPEPVPPRPHPPTVSVDQVRADVGAGVTRFAALTQSLVCPSIRSAPTSAPDSRRHWHTRCTGVRRSGPRRRRRQESGPGLGRPRGVSVDQVRVDVGANAARHPSRPCSWCPSIRSASTSAPRQDRPHLHRPRVSVDQVRVDVGALGLGRESFTEAACPSIRSASTSAPQNWLTVR